MKLEFITGRPSRDERAALEKALAEIRQATAGAGRRLSAWRASVRNPALTIEDLRAAKRGARDVS